MQQDSHITPPKKRVHIETWGCQMNVADSENMLAMLEKANYELTDSEDNADLILLNTCHIREKAKHKVLSRLGVLKETKERRPGVKIAMGGCVAQAEGKKIAKDVPFLDVVFGPGRIPELTDLLKQNSTNNAQQVALGFPDRKNSYPELGSEKSAKTTVSGKTEITRYVNITQGCNNFCTFCVVPHTRGREISRMPEEILKECQSLLDQGAKEITLLGQNVNSYGSDLVERGDVETSANGPFVDLLASACELRGLQRLKFTTSNPHDFSKPLADLFHSKATVMGSYIHLPVQSGDDEVLERMQRKVTAAQYLERVSWLRAVNPEFAISTDLIVGFPGETEAQFEATLELMRKVNFSFVFAFMYSPRKHTAAARFRDQVDDKTKSARLARLNELQNKITLSQNQAEIGKERDVLFLYESKKTPGTYYGRTQHFRLVRVDSNRPIVGETCSVKVIDANKTALVGELL